MSSRDHSVDRPPRAQTPVREQTESIHMEEDELASDDVIAVGSESAPGLPGDSLARGTGMPPEEHTKIASPGARNRTTPPAQPGEDPTRPSQREREQRERSARKSASNRPPPQAQPRARSEKESPDERLGAVLGSYRIADVLGKGGMGYVYRAEHVKLGREVALKLLRSDYAKRRDAVARFFQEARTVNRIRHRNIVDVTDFVELEDGTTFIIMELLRGESLGKWARKGFDLPRGLAVLIQICDGLAAAHTVGVIHRDLKPDNVIIVPTPDGAELVKLLDFGVAKLVNRDDEDVGLETAAGSVIGTPAYMSPEQAGGMPVDARSDIYSVGAIMYELFSGQPMFRGRSFGEYVRKHLSELPPRPRSTPGGADMDDRLEAAILRAIEKDPNRRFSSIAELRDVLLHLLGAIETRPPGRELFNSVDILPPLGGGRPVLMAPNLTPLPPTPIGPLLAPPAAPTLHLAVPVPLMAPQMQTGISSISQLHSGAIHQTGAPPRSTPWWVWFAGGALAVGLGIGGAVWFATRGDEAPPEPAPTPTLTALPETTPPAARLVQINFASLPTAGVFAVGSSTELCRTPCTLDVDLRDGGAQDHRDYVIRRDGHADVPVRVAITGDRIDVPSVVLKPHPPPVIADPVDDDVASTSKTNRSTGRTGKSTGRTGKSTGKTGKGVSSVRDLTGDQSRDTTTTKPVEPDPVKPDPVKPDPVKPHKIDRTDTIDPFAPTKPKAER
jgi:serine/threonine protein kinase